MTSELSKSRSDRLREAIRLKKAAKAERSRSVVDLPPVPEGAPRLLSDLQRSVWLAQRLDPTSCAYNMVSAFDVSAALEQPLLERALKEVVAAHRILRSTFEEVGHEVHQVVHSESALVVEERVCSAGELGALAVREAQRPFDLENGPLLRMVYFRGEGESLLLLVVHHLVADERSLETFWSDFALAYGGASLDRGRPQAEDYIHWAAGESAKRAEADTEFWCQRLDPLPDPLDWSFAAPEPSASDPAPTADQAPTTDQGRPPRGKLIRRPLQADTHKQVKALAAKVGATPFMVYAFAFRLLLHRGARAHCPAFAVPTSLRSHPAAANMVGYFLNPLILDTEVAEDQSIEAALRAFADDFRGCLAHGSLAFQRLLDVVSKGRNTLRQGERHPLFQTMFVYQERAQTLELGGVSLTPRVLDLGEAKFELTLFVSETASGPEVAVEYLTDRFGQVWMERLLAQYEDLLGRLLGGGRERTLAQVSLVGALERRLLDEWQSTPLDTSIEPLLPEAIAARVLEQPNAPAIVCNGETWDYARLGALAHRIAEELVARGVGDGDRVALFVERSPHLIAALLGCHWAGACYVPIDPSYPAERNLFVLEDAAVAAVLASSRTRELLSQDVAPVLVVDELPTSASGKGEDPPQPGPQRPGPQRPTSPDAAAYILYTSGSSGRPKGVVVSHGNLRASNVARFETYRQTDSSGVSAPLVPRRFLLVSSVAFDSSVAGIFWTLASGGALILPSEDESRDPRSLARLCSREQVTSLLCVPSVYAHMLSFQVGAASTGASGQMSTLEMAIVAGESCPSSLVKQHFRSLPGARLFNEYGPTEATVWATASELQPEDAERPVSIGRAIPGVRVRLLDDEGHEVPAGYPGEAWLAGATIAQGYWQRDQKCAEPFDGLAADRSAISSRSPFPGPQAQGGTYRTGDLMSWTLDGRLLFLGRADSQMKIRGVRIEPSEVESALRDFEGVRDAAVVTRGLESGGLHQLVAFVEGETEIEPRLRRHLSDRLPAAMVPHRLVFLEILPELPNGKVDLRQLLELNLGSEPVPSLDDATEAERGLVALWRGLLGVSNVGLDSNFFELGGHSLLVVEMADAIERDVGVELSAADIFQRPTVRELAQLIDETSRGAGKAPRFAHLFPLQPGGRGVPFVMAIPHFFSEMLADTFRGKRPVYGLRGVSLRPEGNRGRWPTMAALGRELADETLERFPGEDLIVGGYSFGASMAFEMVGELERRGVRVQKLILIAVMPLDYASVGPLRFQVPDLERPAGDLSRGEALRLVARRLNPLSKSFYRGLVWRLAVAPMRQLTCLWGDLRKAWGLPLTPRILHADVRLERFRLHRQYRPGSVQAPVVFFNAQEPSTDAAATWRPHFKGPVTVHPTPDPHLGEASKQAAEDLIRSYLEGLE